MIGRLTRFCQANAARCVLALMALVLVAGAVYSARLGDLLRFKDESEYWDLAGYLVSQHRFTMDGVASTAYRPPGYPLVLAVLRVAGLGLWWARMLNFACLAACLWLVYRLLDGERRPLAGAAAALLVLGYPVLFYAAGTIYPQILVGALLLLVLRACSRNGRWWRDALVAGVAYGVVILAVPYFLVIVPLLALHPWILGLAERWRRAALFLAVAGSLTLVWTARNYALLHRFVPVATNGGINFLQGNNPQTATILGGGTAAAELDLTRYFAEAHRLHPGDEVGVSNSLHEQAMRWIRANPWEAAALYVRKCAYYFSYRNDLAIRSEQSRAKDLVMLLTYGPLMALVVVRLLLLRRWRPSRLELLLLAVCAANVLASAVFYPRIRFRLPVDLLLIVVAAGVVERALLRRGSAEPAPSSASAA